LENPRRIEKKRQLVLDDLQEVLWFIQLTLGHKRVSCLDFKMFKFNSELEDVEENSVSPDMDVRLAFEVQDVPSEALAFSNKAKAGYK
jgi:hypothetical protein